MSFGAMWGRRTWIGLAAAAGSLLLWILLGALLLVKGILPEDAVTFWVCAGATGSTLLGGCAAGRGGARVRALLVAVLLYGILWCVGLASSEPLDFGRAGLWITAAVLGGSLAACLLCKGGKGKKKRRRAASGAGKRRRKAVT